MELKEAIFQRRSIRKYTGEEISDDVAKELIKAGMYAPSAGNQQAWEFVIIRDAAVIKQIHSFHPYASMIDDAGVLIVVCGNTEKEKFSGYWVQDCSAATQNILLAAHDQGLGAVWLGVYPMEDRIAGMKELLCLPENIIPLNIISVGKVENQNNNIPNRFDENCIHFEKY